MEQRSSISVVEMHLDDVPDRAFVDHALGGDMWRIPAQRPVDRKPNAGLGDGGEDSIGVGERCREGLFEENVDAERSDRLDAIGMPRRGRAKNGEVRLGRPHATFDVAKHTLVRDGERPDRVGHSRGLRIANADDFRIRMLVRLAQEVAHVHMFETDADDAVLSHSFLPRAPLLGKAQTLNCPGSAWRLARCAAQLREFFALRSNSYFTLLVEYIRGMNSKYHGRAIH